MVTGIRMQNLRPLFAVFMAHVLNNQSLKKKTPIHKLK